MAVPENQVQGGSNEFADNGTASHEWSALALESGKDADLFLGSVKVINGKTYTMDEERAEFCQVYIDDVRRRTIGGLLFVEYKVDLSDTLGEDQGGTADAAIYLPQTRELIVEDLKYGTGEKVYAQTDGEINPQLGLYLLGMLKDMELLGNIVEKVTGVICQPRLHHIDEHTITIAELLEFGRKASDAVALASKALIGQGFTEYLHPGEKQCRWCQAKANCSALARFVADEVKADFDMIPSDAPRDTANVSIAYQAVPLILDWCRAVQAEVTKLVSEGADVTGPDGKPYKFVEGKEGSRKWTDEKLAEAALIGQLGPKAYSEPKLLTAPAAGKVLDKKATKAIWKDIFEPMIQRPRGQPILALGSDPRPPFSGTATISEFEDINE
jgi:hypothetical protein